MQEKPNARKTRLRGQASAVEAVARHFSASWEGGESPPDAYLLIGRKRISVDVTAIKRRVDVGSEITKPRLRFDKVALRVIRGLQAALRDSVPDGRVLIITITAPIRQAAKTQAILEDRARLLLARRSARGDVTDTIQGNQIRIRLAPSGVGQASKVIAFVHNPDTDPAALLDTAQSMGACIGAAAEKRAPARSIDARWLVVLADNWPSHIEMFRHVYAELAIASEYKKILLVLAGGRVEALTG